MPKTKVFKNTKLHNITRDVKQTGIENRGYIDDNPNTSNQANPLDVWYKYKAGRDELNIFPAPTDSNAILTRVQIHDSINRLYNSINSTPVKLDIETQPVYQVGYNFDRQKVFNLVEEQLLRDPQNVLEFIKDPDQFILTAAGINIKNILNYRNTGSLDNTTLPVLKTNIGEIVGQHKDGLYEKGLQGPFTEHTVGGYKHRHQKVGTTADRPERFKIEDNGSSIVFSAPISSASGLDYNVPYSRFSRRGFTKSVVNIRNVKITGSEVIGSYQRTYEITNGLDRATENLAFIANQTTFTPNRINSAFLTGAVDHVLPTRSLPDSTFNDSVFVNKFGAPGDINSTNLNYMDVESEQYTAYNTINYRNASPRKILRSYLSGASYFGYLSGAYGTTASYQKTEINNRRIPISGTSNFQLIADNGYVSYNIPARDGGYLWINNYAVTGNNPGLYNVGIDNDITFITNSADNLGLSQISSSFYTFQDNVASLNTSDPLVLRKYNVKINGLWNFSSKQQLSNHDNKVVINQRENNVYSDKILKDNSRYEQLVSTKQSAISDKYTNIKNVYEENGVREILSYPFAQKYASLMANYYDAEQNKIDNFYKDHRNIKYINKSNSDFKKLLDFDRYKKQNNIGGKQLKEVIYQEKIYPRGQNVFRNFASIRNDYSQSWADSLDNRLTEFTNSQGKVYSALNFNRDSINPLKYSYWPLDANTFYDSVAPASRDKSGELMQLDDPSSYLSSIGSTYTIVVPSGSYFGARFGRIGNSKWVTTRPANVVHEQAGRGPYHNSYTTFYSDIRNMGQGYSIVPEYRISTKLDSYYLNNTSYYDDSFNTLELTGTVIEDYSIAINTSSAFIEQRVNSDYIDLLPYLNKELEEFKVSSIRVKVGAIKKLLPYDEFYPQKQMLKLATQFSSSYSASFTLDGTQKTFRTVLTPFYAPGIAFNSIKAGVGMPFSVAISQSANSYVQITSSLSNASLYYQKLPWETIISPYGTLKSLSYIYDIDPDMILDSTASVALKNVNFIYDYKANNFFAETVNFFKENSTLSTIKSRPSNEWYFPDLNKKYALDIVINKQENFYTYSSFESFGPKPYAFHCPPWADLDQFNSTDPNRFEYASGPNSLGKTYGEGYVRIIFDPASLAVGNLDYFLKGKFNIGDVLRNSTVEYSSSTCRPNSSSYAVNLSDIVDIFNVSGDGVTWQPKLKWECPTADLNFYNLNAKLTNSSGNDSGGDVGGSAIRGIWHQYAPASNNEEGLYLSARSSEVDNYALTGSLLDIVGFNSAKKQKIGTVSKSKEINEALILIPFYQDDCGEDKYFDLDINLFEKMYEQNMGIVGELKEISRNYNLPPALDFIRYRDNKGPILSKEGYNKVKSPFIMFAFEFSSTLGKQDLLDIWQGVMPTISMKAETDYQEKEFAIGRYLKDFNYKLPENMRFKVFKVKQRAVTNYQQIIDRTNGIDYLDLNYGYNWPYDYCSLVEMIEVEAEIVYGYDIVADEKIFQRKNLERNITTPEKLESSVDRQIVREAAIQELVSRETQATQEAVNLTRIFEQPTVTETQSNLTVTPLTQNVEDVTIAPNETLTATFTPTAPTTTTTTVAGRTAVNTQNVVMASETTLTAAPVSAPSFTAPTSQPTSTTAQQSTFVSNPGILTQNTVVSNRTTTTNNVE